MTWTSQGIWQGNNSTNLSLSNVGIGDLIVAEVINFSGSGVWCTGLTGGGCTWVQAGVKFSGTTNAFSAAVFLGTVTATGSQTATPTWSGTAPGSFGIASHELSSSVGSWTFITQGNLDSAGTTNWASLNAQAGDLYFGYAANASASGTTSTTGFTGGNSSSSADGAGNGAAFNPNCSSGATFPVWSDSGQQFGIMVLIREGGPAAPPSPVHMPRLAPGWFPGSAAVTDDPGGIPFYAQPAPADATPAVIVPPTPEAAAERLPLLPPGWVPGADRVTTQPGGIPFAQQPAPADPSRAVLPPAAPDILGIADWLPLPPNWFPGASQVTTDPGSIPFYSLPQPQIPATPPPPPPVITGIGGSGYGSWFTDQNGSPRLAVIEQGWALPFNAGRWNSGNWQSDFTAYFSKRSAQGYTAWYGVAWGSTHVDSTALTGGRSWDGVYALTVNGTPGAIATGGETVALNSAFWSRIDAMFTTARQFGIACFLNMGLTYDRSDAGAIWQNATNTQAGQFGAALAARYPQSQYPNVQWFFGDDDGGGNDSFWAAMLTGMQGAGDTRTAFAIEYETNTNSHVEFDNGAAIGTFGAASAGYNWCYSYDAPYFALERSYTEGGTFAKIPPVYGDGIYYGDSGGGPSVETAVRTFVWWALASGSRGFASTSGPSFADPGAVWMWQSSAVGRLSSDPNGSWTTSKVGQVAAFFSGLTDWNKLIPDTGNAFITAGRGTRGTADPPSSGFNVRTGSTYVAGSITPNGTLAIAYCRAAMSITVDTSKLGAGFTATWVDPSSLATQSAGTGTTYSSSGLGNNSAGQPDWVLVFQGPPVSPPGAAAAPVIPLAPGWFPGSDRVTAEPGGVPFWVVPQPTDQVAAPPAGTTTTATATLAGAAAVAAVVTQAPTATAAGAAAVAAVVTQAAVAAPAATAAIAAVVTQIAPATLAGAGAVTDVATQAATATLAAAATIADVVTQAVIASPAGAATVTASASGGAASASLAAAAAVTAVATVAATATAAGAGAVTAAVTQRGSAALTAAGALSANGAITGAANLAAAGAVSAKVAQAVTAQPAGAAALAALAAQRATAAIAGSGAVAARGTAAASTVQAASAPAVTTRTTSGPAVSAAVSATATVTSKATSSPAVSDDG